MLFRLRDTRLERRIMTRTYSNRHTPFKAIYCSFQNRRESVGILVNITNNGDLPLTMRHQVPSNLLVWHVLIPGAICNLGKGRNTNTNQAKHETPSSKRHVRMRDLWVPAPASVSTDYRMVDLILLSISATLCEAMGDGTGTETSVTTK